MFKKFSLLLAVLFALSAGMVQAQTITYNTGTTWQAAATWTPANGGGMFPGSSVNNGDVTIGSPVTFVDAVPTLALSSLTISAAGNVQFFAPGMLSTITITGGLTINNGSTLTIPNNVSVVVNGPATVNGTITLGNATSRITFNGAVSGAGVINAAALATVQLGTGVSTFPGALLGAAWQGTLQTSGAIALTSNLTTGGTGVLNLANTMTLNSGVNVTIGANATAITGPGNFQGQSVTSVVNMAAFPGANIQGTWFASPFNGRLNTPTTAVNLQGTLTVGAGGHLNLGSTLTLLASANLILNNTGNGTLDGAGTIAFTDNTSILTFGPGFNAGTINADRIGNAAGVVQGTVNTGGNLTVTSTVRANPILTFGTTALGILNLTGTLTIASGKEISILNQNAGALAGSGTLAAAAQSSTVRFGAMANGATGVPGANFANPWTGTLITTDARNLTGSMTIGQTGILTIGGDLTVTGTSTLTLNQTADAATSLTGAGRIVAAAGAFVEIGSNTFIGNLPIARIGTGAAWAAGTLRILGTSSVNANFNITAPGVLNLPVGSVLQVASGFTFTLDGSLTGSGTAMAPTIGRINGTDNTSQVTLAGAFANNTNFGAAGDLPGIVFGKTTGNRAFDGRLNTGAARTLNTSLIMGPNSTLDLTGGVLTVNGNMTRTDTLSLNMLGGLGANPGLLGAVANRVAGAGGVILFGQSSLAATYPGALPLIDPAFTGRIILDDNVNFAANYNTPAGAIMQFNGTSIVRSGQTLTFANVAANSITGTGVVQGETNTAVVAFNAGANGGVVPGARIFGTPDTLTRSFSGRINTAGAMNLSGNLNMGPASILSLGGNLTLSNTSRVLLQQTAAAGTSLPGAGKLVGQPSGVNVPEIILSTGAFITGLGSVMPSTNDITLGNGAGDFGGRLTVGSGYIVGTMPAPDHDFNASVNAMGLVTGTPFTVNTPAILSIVPGATLNVLAGAGIRLNNTNSGATGPGTGRIQGANNTAIVEIGNNFNGGTIPGNLLGVPIPGTSNIPFNGQLVVSGAATLNPGVTMSSVSLLRLNGTTLSVAPGAELRLETPVNGIQGTGTITGSNSQSRITLANNFNGGTFPTARFANPMGGTLTTEGPLTMDGSYAIGTLGALNIGGNFTIPASGILTMSQSGINSFTATGGARIAGQSTSQAILGGNFNNRLLPGAAFTDFPGLLAMNSPLSLTSPLNMNNATGILDLGGVSNVLALHAHNLSVVNPIRNTSATAFIVTNGVGTLSISNAALSSVFFPIGTTNASYTPISIRSTSGTADVFRVRVRNADTLTNPRAFLGFVNREWFISGVAPTVLRGMSITPQWNADNERGTFLRFSTGIAAFSPTAGYVLSQTTATTALQSGALTVSGNLPPIAYSETPIVVFSTRPTFIAPILNPLSISGISPSSVPASNDPFTVSLSGANLNIPGNQISVFNPVNGVRVAPTTTNSVGVSLTLTLPGSLRSVPGVVTISITNANTSFASVTFAVTRVTSPTITGITPVTTASGRAFTVQLSGTGFFSNAIITLNGVGARPVGVTNATTAFVEIPSNLNATSNTIAIRLRNSDGQFAEATYTIGQASRPVITSVNPRAVFSNSPDTQVTINGTGFFGPGNISAFFGAQLIPVRFVSSTQVVVTVPAALLTTPGNPSIILSNSDAQNIGHVFTISERIPLGPTPRIVTVTPSVTTASFRAFSVNIEGENFNPSAVVTVLGQLATVTRTGTTGLAVQIPAGLNTTTNTYEIVIQNPDLQFTSANVRIGDRLTAPTLTGILPSSTIASIQPRAFALTIRGANFTTNPQVLWNGMPLQIASASATEIIVNVPENRVGMYQVIVLNSDGQATAPITFVVQPDVKVTEQTLPNVSVYPSPVYDNMTITAGFAAPVTVRVTVSNVIGQRVMSFTEQASGTYTRNVNMSELPTGAYIVEVSDGARRLVQKIVKY